MCVTQMPPLIQSHPNDDIIYCAFLIVYIVLNYKYKIVISIIKKKKLFMFLFAVYRYKSNERHACIKLH